MPSFNVSSSNFGVSNAEDVFNKIQTEDTIYSFYLGSVVTPTDSANSPVRGTNVYKDASVFKKIAPTDVTIVVEKNDFEAKPFNTWSSNSASLNNFYCYYNGNVYLVIGNNGNNNSNLDGKISPSTTTPPSHTYGIKKYGEYEFLYLFSVQAQDRVVLSGNLWIPVPSTSNTIPFYSGSLIEKKINVDSLSDILIGYGNPVIPIVSDTGINASIKLITELMSNVNTTKSQQKFKIVGIEVTDAGNNYLDYDLGDSLETVLSDESAVTRNAIENAITLGFTPIDVTIREILQANHMLVTASITSTEIAANTDQTQFFSHGLIRGLKDKSGNDFFIKGVCGSDGLTSNNVKITTSNAGFSVLGSTAAASQVGSFASVLSLNSANSTNTTTQKGKIASSKTASGSTIITEAQVHKNPYKTSDGLTNKYGTTFVITAIQDTNVKEGSGTVINIGDTNFNISGAGDPGDHFPKTFITQYLNRFN
tara:strand:- start:138 stop:1574 length:1437 start_codon:yes stop_codon:yes gene_type:complete